jgi:hypothetical protein
MQSYQLGEQVCQVSLQCKQCIDAFVRTAGYGRRLAGHAGKSPAFWIKDSYPSFRLIVRVAHGSALETQETG